MSSLQKVVIFLFMIGFERASGIIELMDSHEIKAIVPKMQKLIEVSAETQQSVWREFKELGYEDKMRPSEIINMIRLLFNGSKISDEKRRHFK